MNLSKVIRSCVNEFARTAGEPFTSEQVTSHYGFDDLGEYKSGVKIGDQMVRNEIWRLLRTNNLTVVGRSGRSLTYSAAATRTDQGGTDDHTDQV